MIYKSAIFFEYKKLTETKCLRIVSQNAIKISLYVDFAKWFLLFAL